MRAGRRRHHGTNKRSPSDIFTVTSAHVSSIARDTIYHFVIILIAANFIATYVFSMFFTPVRAHTRSFLSTHDFLFRERAPPLPATCPPDRHYFIVKMSREKRGTQQPGRKFRWRNDTTLRKNERRKLKGNKHFIVICIRVRLSRWLTINHDWTMPEMRSLLDGN